MRRVVVHYLANEINVSAQTVELIGQERGHFHFVNLVLDLVQPFEQVLPLFGIRFFEQLFLQN
jgi:hypothetical protein